MKKILILIFTLITCISCIPVENRYKDPLEYRNYIVVNKGRRIDGSPFLQICSTDGLRDHRIIGVFELDYTRYNLGDTIK